MSAPPRSRFERVHDYFFPHERNAYRPNFFSYRSLGVVAMGLVILQGIYFTQTKFVFEQTDFLAAVLPAVLTGLTNEDRVEQGLPLLTRDERLAQAAQLVANDMAEKGYFAHYSPDGMSPWYWLDQVDYQYIFAGQNLAVNFTDSKDVEEAWLNSPTHRANIMKREYTRIGIAVAEGQYQGESATFVVQYFATPTSVAVLPNEGLSTVASPEASPRVEEPQGNPTAAGVPSASNEESLRVLGTQDSPEIIIAAVEEPVNFGTRLATSPHSTLMYLLSFIAAVVTVLLAIATATHLRVQYVEVIGGGLALLVLTIAFLAGNMLIDPGVTVPVDSGGSMIETATPR